MRSKCGRGQFGSSGGRLGMVFVGFFLLMFCGSALGAALAPDAPLLAQESVFDLGGGGGETPSSGVSWNVWYIEAAITAVCFLFISVFCFYVIYQMLLRRFWWPKSAYGVTAAMILVATVIVASALFWEDLIGTGSFVQRWWKPGVLWLVSGMTAILLMAVFKSKKV
ncbi:MAG: hypothetical protein ACC628_09340 [Pirellulaceae bacterium]